MDEDMKKAAVVLETLSLFVMGATSVLAQAGTLVVPSTIDVQIPTPRSGVRIITNLGSFISSIVALILIVSALAAFIYLVWGGLRWITSGGDKAAVDAARNQIQAALLGLFIVFAAWAFMIVLEQFFGVSVLQGISIPTPFGPTPTITPHPGQQ